MNKKVVLIVRVIFGIMLIALGSFSFMNLPIPDYPAKAKGFLVAIADTGYMNYTIGLIFMIVGLMFVSGRYVALGALLLAPIIVNVLLFHIFLDIKSIALGSVVAVLNIFIAYTECDKYKPLFMSK